MSQQILVALVMVIGLGVACQWIAWRVRLPAILLRLCAGLCAGPGSDWLAEHHWISHRLLDPNELFGSLLLPVISLSVALILFEGGLTLDVAHLKQSKGVVWRLVTLGAALSGVLASVAALYVLQLPPALAMLLGSILVVTGPTVIGPLLRFVKPTGAVGPILRWEGIVIDPIGALLAVVTFEIVSARQLETLNVFESASLTLLVGGLIGLAGAGLFVLLLDKGRTPDHLQNPLAVMLVLVVFAVSNAIEHESGLAAVTVMGVVLANQRRVAMEHILEFKESLTVLLVASLFILLSARLSPDQLHMMLSWRVWAFIGVLVLVVRPLTVWVSTINSSLKRNERIFLAAMAPRGIVAASVSSVFALRLIAEKFPEADRLVPLTFAVVAGTVLVYGLGGPILARKLGLSNPSMRGFLIVGADKFARMIGETLHREGYEVLLVDTNVANVRETRLSGLPVVQGNAMSRVVSDAISLSSIGRALALTPNRHVNALAAMHFSRQFGRNNVYEISPGPHRSERDAVTHALRSPALFGEELTYDALQDRLRQGAVVKVTKLTKEFDYSAYRAMHADQVVPLFILNERHELTVITADSPPQPKPGQMIIGLTGPRADHRPGTTAAAGTPPVGAAPSLLEGAGAG
ncbi:MAG: cation:proton antiporter [Tepidisphaeraceae bacterium]